VAEWQGGGEVGVNTEGVRKYAAEQGIAEEEAFEEKEGSEIEGIRGKRREVYSQA
jgi:hypothetical protein